MLLGQEGAVVSRPDRKSLESFADHFVVELGMDPAPNATDPTMLADIISSIFCRISQDQFECASTTNNCTWPMYGSLPICSQCSNVTAHIKPSCTASGDQDNHRTVCTYRTPSGLNVSAISAGNAVGPMPAQSSFNVTIRGAHVNITSPGPS